jgi:hypothetical protein
MALHKLSKYLIPSFILILIVVGIYLGRNSEYFQDYQLSPYGEVYSGNDPLYFYNYNRYRKPYRWPFKYYSSYPYPHMSPLP